MPNFSELPTYVGCLEVFFLEDQDFAWILADRFFFKAFSPPRARS